MFVPLRASAWTPSPVLRACLCVAVVAMLFAAPASSTESRLTLAKTQQLALERSRLLPAKDHAAAAAGELATAARTLPDPVLKIGIDNLPLSGSGQFSLTQEAMTMRRIGVMQELTHADKRRLRAERFELTAGKARSEKANTTASILRDSAIAWLDCHFAQEALLLAQEQAAQARLEIEAAEAAYRSGQGMQRGVLEARRTLIDIEDRISELQRALADARVMLARWVGDAATLPLAGKPDMSSTGIDPDQLQTTLARHPEIDVLARQEAIAETDARLARANRRPDWSVEVAYQQRGREYSDMLSVGLSVPLQWNRGQRQDRELAATIALAEQARAEREEALRASVAEVRTMINGWHNLRERVQRHRTGLLPLASAAVDAASAAYRGGKASLGEVIAARSAEVELHLQIVQLEAATARSWARLHYLFPPAGATNK